MKKQKIVEVTYREVFHFPENATDETMYDELLTYLGDCVRNQDVTAFNFKTLDKTPEIS